MSSVETPSKIFEEIAALFSAGPSPSEILEFRPTEKTNKRASELLELNRQGRLSKQLVHELDQYEQAELLMRLVKARIRLNQSENTSPS